MATITQIKTIQTRDCYYPILLVVRENGAQKLGELTPGYYFYDQEFDDGNPWLYSAYFGPYKDLDEVCKKQAAHWKSIQSL